MEEEEEGGEAEEEEAVNVSAGEHHVTVTCVAWPFTPA